MTEASNTPSKPTAWTVVDTRYLIKRWWMNVRVDHVRMGTGVEIEEFHVMEYPDWTCMICRTETDGIVLVEQYRHGVGALVYELPAGVLSSEEDAVVAAQRELLEETGYEADNWQFLGKFSPEPSRHTNWAHFFFADGGRRVAEPRLDHSEDIRAFEVPISQLRQMIERGALVHGVQLSALLLAERKGLLD